MGFINRFRHDLTTPQNVSEISGDFSQEIIQLKILEIPNREIIQDKNNQKSYYEKIIHTNLWRFLRKNLTKTTIGSLLTRRSSAQNILEFSYEKIIQTTGSRVFLRESSTQKQVRVFLQENHPIFQGVSFNERVKPTNFQETSRQTKHKL